MRALLFLSLLMVLAMPAPEAPSQEKKTGDKYPEKVTIRVWDGKKFFNAQEVPVRRGDDGWIYTIPKMVALMPTKGSEVTDSAGTWTVTKALKQANNEYRLKVEKK